MGRISGLQNLDGVSEKENWGWTSGAREAKGDLEPIHLFLFYHFSILFIHLKSTHGWSLDCAPQSSQSSGRERGDGSHSHVPSQGMSTEQGSVPGCVGGRGAGRVMGGKDRTGCTEESHKITEQLLEVAKTVLIFHYQIACAP